MEVVWDESLYTVPIQQQVSFHNRCRRCCLRSSLPHSFAASLRCHRCVSKMNLHPRHWQYDTIACRGREPRGNVQSCLGYRVCFGTWDVVLCKSHDVERVKDAGGVSNRRGKENAGLGGKKGYIYSSSSNFLVQLVSLFNKHQMGQPSSCTTTRHIMTEKPQDEIVYLWWGQFMTRGVTFASHTTLTAQTSCISLQTN